MITITLFLGQTLAIFLFSYLLWLAYKWDNYAKILLLLSMFAFYQTAFFNVESDKEKSIITLLTILIFIFLSVVDSFAIYRAYKKEKRKQMESDFDKFRIKKSPKR